MPELSTTGVNMIRSVMTIHNELMIHQRDLAEKLDSLTKGKDVTVTAREFGGLERKVNDLASRGVITEELKDELNRSIRSSREYARNENYQTALVTLGQVELIMLGHDYNRALAKYMRSPRVSSAKRNVIS